VLAENGFWLEIATQGHSRSFTLQSITGQQEIAYRHITLLAVVSKRRIFSATECVLVIQGRSRSPKVDNFGTNQKRVCDFLLVRHCDYGPILHRFCDVATYWLKLPIFATFSHLVHPFSMFPLWNFAMKLTMRKLESWSYPPRRQHDRSWSIVLTWYRTVTDRQTDRRTDGIYHS